ncbi:MAG: hypothetical protein LUC16_01275 [Coprobacillus sp.]|nr:hypothetical protein [Coprobacillus sp.]
MPKRNKVNNKNVVSSSPAGEDDPLTKELLDYENKNSPVGDRRNKATRIFLIILLALIFALLVVLLLYSIESEENRLVYTILSISFSALGIADLAWYIPYMLVTRKAYSEERKAIDEYITKRIKEEMYKQHQKERAEMLANDLEKEKQYKKEAEINKIVEEDNSEEIDNGESK